MSFLPAIPSSGYLGWLTLKRTSAVQKAAYDNQAMIKREEAYFREKIGSITTAEDLTKDRRLLSVALGAFGLEDDINNRYFIRKVLESNIFDTSSLAMRLSDKRYQAMSSTFGFSDSDTPATVISTFADKIIPLWKERGFEAAVGNIDQTLRLAMNAERELAALAKQNSSEGAKWFNVLGQKPLRQIFETVFGLPTAFAMLDIDRQKQILTQKASAMFGSEDLSQFADGDRLQNLLKRFLLKSQTADLQSATLPGSAALTLLSQARPIRARN